MCKKLLAGLIAAIFVFSLFGCGGGGDYGDINDVESTAPPEEETAAANEESDFNPQNTNLKYKWKYEDIGRACLSLPYPASWQVSKKTDYDICFVSPEDDPYFPGSAVYFHSTLESGDIEDIHQLYKTTFASQMLKDKFPYKDSYLQMGFSSVDKTVVNTQVSDPELNYQTAFKDWDANALLRGTSEIDESMYHQATCFYWQHYPCILTGLTFEQKADDLDDLLTYMMSNARYISDQTDVSTKVTVFPKTTGLTIPMSPLYEQVQADPGKKFSAAAGFMCPADSGTGYSQSSLFIYETDTEGFDATLEDFEKYKSVIIGNASGIENPNEQTEGYMKYDSGYVDFGKTRADEYVYEFSVTDYENIPDGCFPGQIWRAVMYPLEHNGKTDLIVLCGPTDSLIWAMDLIRFLSKGISYKN